MTWGAVAVGTVSAVGAYAANQSKGGKAGGASAPPIYGQNPSQYNPYYNQYGSAMTAYQQSDPLSELRSLMAGDITSQPGYQYQRQQALGGVQAQAAASGRHLSGNELSALTSTSSNLAAQNYQTLWNNAMQRQGLVSGQLQQNVSNYAQASQGAAGWQNALSGYGQVANQAQEQNYGQYQNLYSNYAGAAGMAARGIAGYYAGQPSSSAGGGTTLTDQIGAAQWNDAWSGLK